MGESFQLVAVNARQVLDLYKSGPVLGDVRWGGSVWLGKSPPRCMRGPAPRTVPATSDHGQPIEFDAITEHHRALACTHHNNRDGAASLVKEVKAWMEWTGDSDFYVWGDYGCDHPSLPKEGWVVTHIYDWSAALGSGELPPRPSLPTPEDKP